MSILENTLERKIPKAKACAARKAPPELKKSIINLQNKKYQIRYLHMVSSSNTGC